MASELVSSATSDKLPEVDWAKNIEICELVARDPREAKNVTKAIKKRLSSKSSNAQLYAVVLLEMLMNNIGEAVHKQVIEAGLLPILVKIVKKKSDGPVRERIFLLLDATQTSVGGASGKFPQYYNAYYELVSAGVKFPQRPHAIPSDQPPTGASQNVLTVAQIASANGERAIRPEESQPAPGSSIIEKASAAMEVLREVLDAVDPQNAEAGKDEFTLDLVEQCSFQKDRVMHLVMSSRDERLVSRAIELNEQLGKILARHEALLSHRPALTASPIEHRDVPTATSNHSNHVVGKGTWASNHNNHSGQQTSRSNGVNNHIDYEETEEEEEEAEQLSRRIRKGKAHVKPEDEESDEEEEEEDSRPSSYGLSASTIPSERLNRPLIRPLSVGEDPEMKAPPPLATSIPPPPSKHVEREKFFQEKRSDATPLAAHMRGLSLHSRNASNSSFTGSVTSND